MTFLKALIFRNLSTKEESGMVYDNSINGGQMGIYYERLPNLGLNVYGMVQSYEMAQETSALNQTIDHDNSDRYTYRLDHFRNAYSHNQQLDQFTAECL
ncbi:MAG: hypothetical protein U5K84_10760 [Alkalibacterium sp.]|nr:hypothetical protein [Alkalibacterium sp.]